ncbi:hypothetical protein E2C01_068855 [Portunus trituberculatus]|uniref:Uncharacterized protein n=1 Tax=Portunus trituberculatus TaxID=210409 RepID=A0A5B7HXC6_PORTR|nr:hypothetical protein [Portunus trituberculatus]
MNKAPTKKRSAEAISEEHTFTASPVDSQDACLAAGQPRETIIHVKKVKLPAGGAEKLRLPAAADCMASPDLTRQKVNPRTPAAVSAPTDSPSLSPGLQNAMDTDAASRASLSQPDASHPHVSFSEGHGKTLAQLCEWFMALLKQHLSLEPLMKEDRCRPYLTVNSRSAVYDMVKEGFLSLTMTPADPDARQQMVIVHGVSTAINVDLLATPEDFLWLKRCVVAGEPRPQLLGLVEGTVPSLVHLLGLVQFRMGLYTPEPDLCGHFCQFGH